MVPRIYVKNFPNDFVLIDLKPLETLWRVEYSETFGCLFLIVV